MTASLTPTTMAHQNLTGQNRSLSRQLAASGPQLRCPTCKSILYTRRHKKCAVCEAELPAQLLFSETEALRIKMLVMMEQEKHRDWLAKAGSSWR